MSTPSRRLVAIMFTDLVGFSASAHADEDRALAMLDEHRRILRRHFQEHQGEEIKTIGDAFLVIFASAVDAVGCAVAIQEEIRARNATHDAPIHLRIGIHLGDVVYRDGDVHGDGVNIASRLEPLSPPGGICVSRPVHDAVRANTSAKIRPLGPRSLKGVGETVDLFHLFPASHPTAEIPRRLVPTPSPTHSLRATMLLMLAALGLAAVLYVSKSPEPTPPAVDTPIDGRTTSAPRQSIAVLPFVNMSSNPDYEYLGDGLTEELIDALARVEGLRVCARTSAFAFKGKAEDVRVIGRKLGVGTLLEGSVRATDDELRITVQLIDAGDGLHIWSEQYARPVSDLFQIQEEIAQAVVAKLQVSLQPDSDRTLVGQPPRHLDAYHAYLRGRFFWGKRSEEGIRRATQYFRQALELDPDFAPALAGMADCYVVLPSLGVIEPDAGYEQAEQFAQQALELDEGLAEAHAALGMVRSDYGRNWEEARREFERAIALQPSYATARQWLSVHLVTVGDFEEAVAEAERARLLDPLSLVIQAQVGQARYFARDYEGAVSAYDELLEMDDTFVYAHLGRAMCFMQMGRYEEALREVDQEPDTSDFWVGYKLMVSACTLALAGDRDQAEASLLQLEEMNRRASPAFPGFVAMAYAALGDEDRALTWLEHGFRDRDAYVIWLHHDPLFDPWRETPRYLRILKELNLPGATPPPHPEATNGTAGR